MSFVFMQLADPQFRLFAHLSGLSEAEIEALRQRGILCRPAPKITGFADETRLYGKAIAEANRLRPDFVVTCGETVNDADAEEQRAELFRITGMLDAAIPMHWVAGNHDISGELTPESLATYRQRFGDDDYLFDHGGSRFVVLDSNIAYDPTHVPGEWERQVDFLRDALVEARRRDSDHVVFTHHPLFLSQHDEPDGIFAIPQVRRRVLRNLLTSHGATATFSGHYHRNSYGSYQWFQIVTSGAVGYPMADSRSGYRIVQVHPDRLEHEYHALE